MPTDKVVREIRIDPIVPTESVLISTARSQRPTRKEKIVPRDESPHVETCPFCRGNEHMTPPAISTYSNNTEWSIRIVENLYPVLGEEKVGDDSSEGLRHIISGYGRHEVIIDHHHHGIALYAMSKQHLALLFRAYKERMFELYQSDNRLRYVMVFKNFGPAAGASIPHTHSQMIAMPVIPENVQAEIQFSHTYHRTHHQCIFCTLIDEAMTFSTTVYDRNKGETKRTVELGEYVIEKGEHFIAIKPFASRYEWEVHILPIHHQADYLQITEEEMKDLASVTQRTMARLESVLEGAQYNYFLHTVPHQGN